MGGTISFSAPSNNAIIQPGTATGMTIDWSAGLQPALGLRFGESAGSQTLDAVRET